jgi:hypothetical protein
MIDVKKCTTYELEHKLNAFTWYPNRLLSQAKRELDKRYRERTLKQQWENLKKEMKNNLK